MKQMFRVKRSLVFQASIGGFTLLELLVTLVVVGILALVSIPVMRDQLNQSRLKAAAEIFIQTAQVARSEAITRQQTVYLNLVTGSNWCYGSNVTSSCSCSPTNNCGLAYVLGSLYPRVTVTSTGFTGASISFDSVRGLASEASVVTFAIDSQLINVTISRLSGFSLCATGVSGYSAC